MLAAQRLRMPPAPEDDDGPPDSTESVHRTDRAAQIPVHLCALDRCPSSFSRSLDAPED
jgi:hypothetical protein